MTRRGIRTAAFSAALVVVTLAAFRGLDAASFILYDDNGYVTENNHVKAGLAGQSIAWAFTTGAQANWHPVTWLSHMTDVSLFGLDPGKHHLMSVAIHAANAVLLFLVLFRMTGASWRSGFAACLFAIHPLHVESVAWIAERKDVLSTMFWLLTLLSWLRYLDVKTPARYAATLACYALALMAKPMPVTLPFTLLLLDYWPLHRTPRAPLWREKLPLFAVAAASCVVTFAVQQRAGAVQTLSAMTFSERVANALSAYASYLAKTFRPESLAVFYPYPDSLGLFTWRVAAALAVLGGITALAWRLRRTAPYLAVGWLWYLGTLVPVVGLVQVGGQAMADRYTYVPLIGIFIAVAWGLAELGRGSRAFRYAAVAVACASLPALGAVTHRQVGYWAGDVPLFRHAIAVTSANWLAHNNLGRGLFAQGRIDEAVVEYTEALRISPGYADAHYNLGLARARSGRPQEAIGEFEEALRLKPDFAAAHNNLGGVLAGVGRPEAAIEQYQLAIRLDPDNAEAPYNLGNALFAQGRFDAAIEQYVRSVALAPDRAEAHNNLGNALVRQGRIADAIPQYEQALRLDPGLEEASANLRALEAASSHGGAR
jgi:tetratricopeptide (TPR) repeat protein